MFYFWRIIAWYLSQVVAVQVCNNFQHKANSGTGEHKTKHSQLNLLNTLKTTLYHLTSRIMIIIHWSLNFSLAWLPSFLPVYHISNYEIQQNVNKICRCVKYGENVQGSSQESTKRILEAKMIQKSERKTLKVLAKNEDFIQCWDLGKYKVPPYNCSFFWDILELVDAWSDCCGLHYNE